jgi:hypothetical protein
LSLKFPARGLGFYLGFGVFGKDGGVAFRGSRLLQERQNVPPGKGVWGTGVPQLDGNAAHFKCSRLLRLRRGVKGSTLPGFCLQMSFFPSGIVGFQRSHPAIRASIDGPWAARAPNDKFGSRKENALSPINRTFLKRPKNSSDARHSEEIQTRGLQKVRDSLNFVFCSLCF